MPTEDSVLTVRTEHLTGEMLLIDLGHATIVSDHPEQMGGQGKGPNPGEFVKGALASSAALAIGELIEREKLAVSSFSVACSTGFETERREEGPLPSTTTLANFQLRIAVAGDVSSDAIERIRQAAGSCSVARALAAGIAIEEEDVFRPEPAARGARASSHLVEQMHARRPEAGQKIVLPVNTQTAVKAEYLGDGRALVKWSKSSYLAETARPDGGRPHGGQPEALLLAGLSACTSVFVARAAAVTAADAEVRVVTSGGFDPASGAFRMHKTLEVTGDLDERQKRTLAHFGDNCAIGETLRRKAQIGIAVDVVEPAASRSAGLSAAGAEARAIESSLDSMICDDGACCVPNLDLPTERG